MTGETGIPLLDDVVLRRVALGTAGLGAVTGLVGTFAVVRRRSLQGDAVSHAALLGLAVAFLFGSQTPTHLLPAVLLAGAAAAGWAAMAVVGGIVRHSRVPFDTALGGTLSVFFGGGIALMAYLFRLKNRPPESLGTWERWIADHTTDEVRYGLDRYLFGQAATMQPADVWLIAAAGAVIAVLLGLFWKEFKVLSFDPDYAAALGLPVRRLDWLLTALTVAAVVVGLQAVGVVLMSTLLVAPAVAARQWTDHLGRLVGLAAGLGALAGAAGTVLSHSLGQVPTGATIALSATVIAGLSLLAAPRRGIIARLAISRKRVTRAGGPV